MKKQKKLEYKKKAKPVEVKEEKAEAAMPVLAKMDDDEDEMSLAENQHMLETLMKAEEIKANPKKMEKVHKLAGRKSVHIKSIQDLKDIYAAKVDNGDFKKKA